MELHLDYFYGDETAEFCFCRLPKALLGGTLSLEAAALYSLMLDRVGLSVQNGWRDGLGRVFIYFVQKDVQRLLRCGHNRATALMRELEDFGLIERRRQGLGRPAMIYVKNFSGGGAPAPENTARRKRAAETARRKKDAETAQRKKAAEPARRKKAAEPARRKKAAEPARREKTAETAQRKRAAETAQRKKTAETVRREKAVPAVPREDASRPVLSPAPEEAVRTARKGQSRVPAGGGPDCLFRAANNTEKNETELSETHPILRRMEEMDWLKKELRANMDYESLVRDHPWDRGLFDGYVELMAEAACSTRQTVRICGQDIPTEAVRSRFLRLEREHILYVRDCLCSTAAAIGNIKAYTLAALYNAPVTMEQYYASLVSCHEGGRGG